MVGRSPKADEDDAPADSPFAPKSAGSSYDEDEDEVPFTGSSPFVGTGAGDARVDETRIDAGLRVDTKVAEDLASKSAGGPVADDEEPADSTKIDEFRLSDLDDEETSVQAAASPSDNAVDDKPADDEKTDEAAAGSRSPKDKM